MKIAFFWTNLGLACLAVNRHGLAAANFAIAAFLAYKSHSFAERAAAQPETES